MRHSMKRLLGLKPVQKVVKDVQRFEGEVLKKGMFLVKRYWVVLSRGIAAFYNRKEDSANSLNRKVIVVLILLISFQLYLYQVLLRSFGNHRLVCGFAVRDGW